MDHSIETRALTVATLPDLLDFLGGPAFTDNPEWSGCYCQFYYEDHDAIDWKARAASDNRRLACARTENGVMQGLLAYQAGEVIGWCNAAPRENLLALGLGPGEDGPVASIVCFVIDPASRRTGVARALLESVCHECATRGMSRVEAYPQRAAKSSSEHYRGPLELYLSAGFEIAEELEGCTRVVRALP